MNKRYIRVISRLEISNIPRRKVSITDLQCPVVRVSNAGAEDGLYQFVEGKHVPWAEERQVYRNMDNDRYVGGYILFVIS